MIRVELFRPEWAGAFSDLNRQWIEQHFVLEDADLKVLRDPDGAIIDKGGQIFVALDDDTPVGVVAVIPARATASGPAAYELAKMAVAPSHQRLGLGEMLGRTAIEWVRSAGGDSLYLETNSKLANAIRLYERLGFAHATPPTPSPYARSNVYMTRRA